ncbi:MAG: hypothetical protein JXA38_00820 [Methanosarcinaceae archaeon]|nr:hypothetical protein [Methanosarcinaceae archaeon]
MSYYKFKNPMDNRLTYESWRNLPSTKTPYQPK